MWYFSWILGTGLACAFAILNAVWLELRVEDGKKEKMDQMNPV
jgi:cyd operon protein YbgT